MKPTFWERLDAQARALTPFGLAVFLVLIGGLPFHMEGFVFVAPMLPLMAIFHWTVYRPDLMPVYAVFVVGLLQDILGGMPLGVSALVYIAVFWGVLSQRRFLYGKSFFIVWLGFAIVALLAQAATWFLVSIFYVVPLVSDSLLYQYLVTLGAFPLLAWSLIKWQQTVLGEGE